MQNILRSAFLSSIILLAASPTAAAQTTQTAAQGPPGPEEVVRGFYAFYLGELNRENWSPLKRRREALKYLTPEFHRRIPRIIEAQMVDIIICAQDWDPKWAEGFTVAPAHVRASRATTVVTLPPFGGAGPGIQIKLTLVKRGTRWLINAADCVD